MVSARIPAPLPWSWMIVLTGHGGDRAADAVEGAHPDLLRAVQRVERSSDDDVSAAGVDHHRRDEQVADGFHGRIAPVEAFAAASRPRDWNPVAEVPTVEKSPPK